MGSLPRPRWGARDEGETAEPSIQLAPLVDIVFLLLIFFLVATTYLDEEKDLTLVLPRTSAGKAGGPRLERILLNIRPDGTVFLGKDRLDRGQLYRVLVEARRGNPRIPVILRGDRSASHGDIVRVLSVCQRARIRNVAVAVGAEREGESADESPTEADEGR